MGKNLFTKVWENHQVSTMANGYAQLFIDLHLIHEVTSPQAFSMLAEKKIPVLFPERTVATVDHIVPTDKQHRPYQDSLAEAMVQALERNTADFGIRYHNEKSKKQGIVHIIAPEQGLTRPGMTIVCGDSHTATHGAFGAIAFGIGTSQVRDVLASQTIATAPLKVRKINCIGQRPPGVTAKDIILNIIGTLGAEAGVGYAYEYAGPVIEKLSMDERMTICNMSIEGGARCGYINPDTVTLEYLRNALPDLSESAWQEKTKYWLSFASDVDASYDDYVTFDVSLMTPTVTWGVSPDQSIGVDQCIPQWDKFNPKAHLYEEAIKYMGLKAGTPIKHTEIQVAFIGSCTNGRLEDFISVSQHLKGKRVSSGIRAYAVPGSVKVHDEAEALGVADIFREAGFEWRSPGCSMCLAMNPDKLRGQELCASSSNRNFKGRQGSPKGRTMLMSPLSVAAAAVQGSIADPREVFELSITPT